MLSERNLPILGCGICVGVPRGLYTIIDKHIIHLRCDWDENAGDYRDYYDVFLIVGAKLSDFYTGAIYQREDERAHLGRILVEDASYDVTKLQSLRSAKLEALVKTAIS